MLKCILIVDDNEQIRRLIRDLLERESGFEVCGEAVDGYDAIEKAKQLKPRPNNSGHVDATHERD